MSLAGRADLAALRLEFPFLLDLDSWLAGLGTALFDSAVHAAAGGSVSLR